MGVLTKALGFRNLSLEDPAQALMPYSALVESLGLGRSDAGVLVNEKQAMRITTAFACITIISTDLSSLPLSIFQRMPDGSMREAIEHPMHRLLHDEPNPAMTSMVFRGALLANVLGWGNAYAYIKRDNGSRVRQLTLLPPERTSAVMIKQPDGSGKMTYATTATIDGSTEYIEPANMLHISGLSNDGITGLSPIGTCKNAFGLAIAAEKFGAQLFGNGSRTTGVLSYPGQLSPEAQENLKKSLREAMTGDNALRPFVLEEGMTWNQISINPNDAQFLETRKFQRSEIAALFRVALHLLQDLDRSTNNNIEHQSLDHIRYTLRPWAIRIEQEINRKLLSGTYFCEHDFNAFQRGDFASQTAGFATLRNVGAFSTNDILRQMRMNPIPPEEGGDVRTVPLNTVSLATFVAGRNDSSVDDTAAEAADPAIEQPITDLRRQRIVNAYRRLFRDAVGRVVNRKQHDAAFAYRAFQPVIASMAEAAVVMYFNPDVETQNKIEQESNSLAHAIAADSAAWLKAEASAIATRITDQTYVSLHQALIG